MLYRKTPILTDSALRALRFHRPYGRFTPLVSFLRAIFWRLPRLLVFILLALAQELLKLLRPLFQRRPTFKMPRLAPRKSSFRMPAFSQSLALGSGRERQTRRLPRWLNLRAAGSAVAAAVAAVFSRLASRRRPGFAPARHAALLSSLSGVCLMGVVAASTIPDSPSRPANVPTRQITQTLPAPEVELLALPANDLPFIIEERIKSGDTLHSLFRRMSIRDKEAQTFIAGNALGKQALRELRARKNLRAAVRAQDRKLLSLTFPGNKAGEKITIRRTESGKLVASKQVTKSDTTLAQNNFTTEMRSGIIRHSLFATADTIGLPDRIASKLAEIFATKIDFSRELQRGDRFSVIYEVAYNEGVISRTGRILAAQFINRDKTYTLVAHPDDSGRNTYYTPDGASQNTAFMRYPLEFTRVSSKFGRRLHPIHKSWRNHNGTDFAAPKGTPIKASSDGTVRFVGKQRGYGNVVIINHRSGYSTLYAHMNGFKKGMSKGKKVSQGDVIGYVGMTGWATGPHLHYEIRVNNVPRDPMKIALPPPKPMSGTRLARFKKSTAPLIARIQTDLDRLASSASDVKHKKS